MLAPENIIERDGIFYATLKNNQIVKIVNDEIKIVADFGKSCCKSHLWECVVEILILNLSDTSYELKSCGRPLGSAFDIKENSLIVIQSYEGVYEVNIETGEKKLLVSRNDVIGDNVRAFISINSFLLMHGIIF